MAAVILGIGKEEHKVADKKQRVSSCGTQRKKGTLESCLRAGFTVNETCRQATSLNVLKQDLTLAALHCSGFSFAANEIDDERQTMGCRGLSAR